MEEKAAAEARLEVLEHNLTQALVAESSALLANGCMPPRSGQPGPGTNLLRIEHPSGSEHADQGQPKGSLAEDATQNESLMSNLYCDYTAWLQQIKMLQTSLEAALNDTFDPGHQLPNPQSRDSRLTKDDFLPAPWTRVLVRRWNAWTNKPLSRLPKPKS